MKRKAESLLSQVIKIGENSYMLHLDADSWAVIERNPGVEGGTIAFYARIEGSPIEHEALTRSRHVLSLQHDGLKYRLGCWKMKFYSEQELLNLVRAREHIIGTLVTLLSD